MLEVSLTPLPIVRLRASCPRRLARVKGLTPARARALSLSLARVLALEQATVRLSVEDDEGFCRSQVFRVSGLSPLHPSSGFGRLVRLLPREGRGGRCGHHVARSLILNS